MAKKYDDFLKDADWNGTIATLSEKGKDSSNDLTSDDYANRAYARCFQVTKAHNDGNYEDVIEDATKALVLAEKDDEINRALRIRAYAYYLNGNYDDAITDCERVIERASCCIDATRKNVKDLWAACSNPDGKDAGNPTDEQETSDNGENVCQNPDDEVALKAAKQAQEAHCNALRCTTFVHELLGIIYSDMDRPLEASKQYKLALLARQTDIVSASPLLMDAYRNARAAVKGF